jgi:predicted O-methyltransferase YrrM
MNDSTNAAGDIRVKKLTLSDALGTVGYQLGCIWLILRSYPTLGVLGHYLGHYSKRLALFLLGHRGPHAQEIESAVARFRAVLRTRQFTADWFDNNIWIWTEKLADFRARHSNPNILEIGSFEGRSTLFFLTHFPESYITVVDSWGGDDKFPTNSQLQSAEVRFDSNVLEYKERITKLRGKSAECLAKLASGQRSRFDLIYIDGSHYADDVMIDAALAWLLLRNQGILIFDDYVFFDYRHGLRKSSCRAINLFLRLIAGEFQIKHVAHQIIIVKTHSPRDAALSQRLAQKDLEVL